MADQDSDILGASDTCDETIEYDNRILDNVDIELEELEEYSEARSKWEEIEQKFARYERNYRVRRIKELTTGPPVPRRRGRGRPRKLMA